MKFQLSRVGGWWIESSGEAPFTLPPSLSNSLPLPNEFNAGERYLTQYVGMHFATAWAQIPSELETVFMPQQNLNSLLATFSASFIIHYL